MRSPRHFSSPARSLTAFLAVAVAVTGLTAGDASARRTDIPAAAARAAAPDPQAPATAASGGPREFFYDAAGQLVGVADPATGSAAYRYDDAGNLLRTERLSLDALAVFAIVPARGPVGSSVEISGTGFSTTADENVVTVDGITAPVSRATAHRLTVQIPEGATDGVVEVSVAGKSATSPRPFRIEAGAPVPGITAVSTDRGDKDDLVTITGTGFDPEPTHNVVQFHRTVARVLTATTTQLTVRVPAAASSGRISVRTPGGTAQSPEDFFVAPRGFRMSDLVPSGRLKAGDPTLDVTVPAGKSALVLLDGTAGEMVNLRFTDNTIPVRSALWMYTPYGGNFARGTLGDPLDLWAGGPLSQDLPKLTSTGTYALVIKPNDGAGGAVRITASNTLTGAALTADGSGVPFQITVPQQPFETTFTATADQWMSLGLTDLSEPANTYVVTVTAPDNTTYRWEASLTRYTPTMVFRARQTGTYRLAITFGPNELGFGRVWLSTVISGGTLEIDGPAVPLEIQRPGQSVRLPFTGTAGQVLQLGYTENTLQMNDRPAYPAAIMVEPDEVQVTLETGWAESRDIPTLRKTGEHSIFVTGWQAVGGITAWLSTRAEGGELLINSKKTVTIDRPGRDVWLDFNGVQGRPLYLGTTDRSLPGEVNLRLYRPDGRLVSGGVGRTIDLAELPDTGAYRLQVDPESPGLGSLAVVAAEPLDVGALVPDAEPTQATVELPGQRIVATFTGQAGQRLSLGATGEIEFVRPRIFRPDNTQLDYYGNLDLRLGLDLPALPLDGTYRIELTPYDAGTGAYHLLLSSELNVGQAELGGPAKTFTITRPGQNGVMTFEGVAADRTQITLSNLDLGGNGLYFTLIDPSGATLARHWWMYYYTESLPTLTTDGTYTLIFDPANGATGSFDMAVQRRIIPSDGTSEGTPVDRRRTPAEPKTSSPRGVIPTCPTEPERIETRSAPALQQPGQPAPAPQPAEPPAPDCEDTGWTPDARNLDGVDWRTRNEPAPTRARALQFPVGVTGVVGRVLDTNGKPLAKVTVSGRGRSTVTDADGRFALAGVPGGHLSLRVDGRTGGTQGRRYGVFDIGVKVTKGEVLVLPYTIFLPRVDTAHTVSVPSPTNRDIVLTTPAIPGLEVHIPKGTVVRDADGKVAHELSLTPIPVDRPPFPLPPTRVPVYFSVQPGGGVLFPEGARIIYPNYTKEPPGTRTQFWNYDPDGKGWHIYGLGTVSADGKQIIPDPEVRFYRLTGAMTAVPGMNPARVAPKPNGTRVGDPVDPATGLLVDEAVDLTVSDIVPIQIKRTYQQGDVDVRPFGVGMNFDYGLFPWSPGEPGNFDFQQFDLVQPDGSKIHYTRTSPGDDYAGAIFAADPTPTQYAGSTVAWNGDGWDVTLRDGTVFVLGDEAPVQEIRDKYGNTTTITRATAPPGTDGKVRLNGAITQITSPNGRWVKFSYDQANPPKITKIEDNIGRTVSYTYDSTNRLTTVTDPRGGVTRYTWEDGLLKSITNPRGITYLVNTYDEAGRVATQTGPDGGVTRFDYVTVDDAITETVVTDPEGHKRRFTFNAQGAVLTDTKAYGTPLAQTTTNEYDESGVRLLATVDPLGRRTTYGYDDAGRVIDKTTLAGTSLAQTERFEYGGPHGEQTRYTDGYGGSTVYELDDRGAVTSITDPMNRTTTLTVDGAGLVTAVTDPAGKTRTTEYAGADPVRVTDPLGRVTVAGFDAIGRQVRLTDARGAAIDTRYDAAGNVRSVTDGLGRTTTFEYDANGNQTQVTDARGGSTVYTYNSRDLIETITDPLGATETLSYDANGLITAHTSRRGVVTSQEYDALGRATLTQIGSDTISYQYDEADRLVRTEDSVAGVATMAYDDRDRLIEETTAAGTVTYSYGTTVRDRTMTVAGQPPVRHVFDATGELVEVQRDGVPVTTISRDVAGRVARIGAPGDDGTSQSYAYTDAGEVASITYRAGQTQLGDLGYEYDAAGHPIRTTGTFSRTELPEPFGPATYDAANRLRTVGDTTVSYDADGNLISDGTTQYTWNDRGELIGLSREGYSATFGYAADGRRLSRTIDGSTTTYLYDGMNPVREQVGGTTTATMISGGVDEFHLRESGGVTRRYLTDAVGSTLGLVDDTGAGAEYAYQPFGVTTVTGDDGGNPYRFTGREDDGTGLYYYRQRYYSPQLQRFISEDPIGLTGGPNLHAYVGNQPTVLRDPTGERPAGSGGGCPGSAANSFTPDTRVLMADGTSKRIADVRVGDEVLATDPETGETRAEPVTATIIGEGDKKLVTVSVDADGDGAGDGTVTATDGHPFWDAGVGAWRAARELRGGEWLRTGAGTYVQVTAVDTESASLRVHNLTVANLHTYYVLAGDHPVLVHNTGVVGICPKDPRVDHGKLGEMATRDRLVKEGYTDIFSQVRFRNSKGDVFIADFVARDKYGNWVAIEAKTGRGATITVNQAQGYPELGSTGAVLDTSKLTGVGIPKGTNVTMRVDIDLWTCPICGSAP